MPLTTRHSGPPLHSWSQCVGRPTDSLAVSPPSCALIADQAKPLISRYRGGSIRPSNPVRFAAPLLLKPPFRFRPRADVQSTRTAPLQCWDLSTSIGPLWTSALLKLVELLPALQIDIMTSHLLISSDYDLDIQRVEFDCAANSSGFFASDKS